MKASHRNDRLVSLISRLSGEFIARATGGQSLVTVTQVVLSEGRKYATIFFTAYPEDKEEAALMFLKRNINELRAYIENNARIGRMPFLSVAIDHGEKNRQRIEELSITDPHRKK